MSVNYIVHYSFVDTSYWDEGNRSTSRTRSFKTYEDAVKFCENAVSSGVIEAGEQGEVATLLDKDDIYIEKVTSENIPWYRIFQDKNYLVTKIERLIDRGDMRGLLDLQDEVIGWSGEIWRECYERAKKQLKESK